MLVFVLDIVKFKYYVDYSKKDLIKEFDNYILNGVKRNFFDSFLLNDEDVLIKRYRIVFLINDLIDSKFCGFLLFILNDVFF